MFYYLDEIESDYHGWPLVGYILSLN